MAHPEIPQKAPYALELEPGKYWWCSCGKSAKQPFCDGAHAGSEFAPVAFEIEETKKVWLCGCKHTAGQPMCDGAHKDL